LFQKLQRNIPITLLLSRVDRSLGFGVFGGETQPNDEKREKREKRTKDEVVSF